MEAKKIIFGRNPVLEYIKSIEKGSRGILYISENAHGKIIDIITEQAKGKGLKIARISKDDIRKFEPSSRHQGVVLELPENLHAGPKNSLSDFLEKTAGEKGVLILLDQIADPYNLGSIIRTAEALGAAGAVITKAHSADITATVAKTSAGATAHLPVFTVANAAGFIETAKRAGFWIIGTSDKSDTELNSIKKIKPSVIVIGSEGSGMRKLTWEKCDYTVRIPLKGKISSLNASVAAGIILYEILKDAEEKEN